MKSISFSVVISSVAVLVFGGLYGWLYIEIQTKNTALADVVALIHSRDGEDARLEALETLVEETADERLLLEQHFVSNDGVALFLEEVESLGPKSQTEIEILSVDVQALVPEENLYEGLTVALSGVGTFNQIMELIARIEALPYPVSVGQTRLEVRNAEKKKQWTLSISFTVLKKK